MERNELISLFDSERDFFQKLGIYLKTIVGNSVKFKIEDISDGFINLRIYSPTEYRKGVKISSFLDFFGGGGVVEKIRGSAEDREGGSLTDLPDWGGGGDGGC